MAEERYPKAERIVLVMDNLNIHTLTSRSGAQKLEILRVPKEPGLTGLAEADILFGDRSL